MIRNALIDPNAMTGTGVASDSLITQLAQLGFRAASRGRRQLYLGPEIAAHACAIDRFAQSLRGSPPIGAGNRGGAFRVELDALPPLFVRRYLRGGMIRFLVSELYAGVNPRPLRELAVTAQARQRGLPVVQPMGAIVEAAGPWLYRGWFLTGALEGVTLWNLLLGGKDRAARRQALLLARASIDRLHQGGLYHADLNFHNLLLCTGAQPRRVIVLDLDKARLYPGSLPPARRRANFDRLRRSASRLAAAGANLTREERALVGIA